MLDLYSLSVLVFFAVLAVLIYRDRKNIEFKYVLFIRRTKRFGRIIDDIAYASPRFWKAVATLGIIVCFYFMLAGFFNILLVVEKVLSGEIKQPAIGFVLPVVSAQPVSSPAFIGVPFWFWIITVAIILIPHELFHGIVSRAEKIPLKSVGLLLLAIFPGAFVEPDEKKIQKKKLLTKLRVFAAGSFINIIIALMILFLTQSYFWNNGILVTDVNSTSPAAQAGLQAGMVIEKINDKTAKFDFAEYSFLLLFSRNNNSVSEQMPGYLSRLFLFSEMSKYKPGQNITLKAGGIDYSLILGKHPLNESFPYMGISTQMNMKNELFVSVYPLLGFMWLLSLLIGVFNILPLYPLDGGLMVEALAERFSKKNAKQITRTVTIITVMILLITVVGPFLIP